MENSAKTWNLGRKLQRETAKIQAVSEAAILLSDGLLKGYE